MDALSPYRLQSAPPAVAFCSISLPSSSLPTCTAPCAHRQAQALDSGCPHRQHKHQNQPLPHVDLGPFSPQDFIGSQPSSLGSALFVQVSSQPSAPVKRTRPTPRGRLRIHSKTPHPPVSSGAVPPQLDIPSQGSESPEPVRSMARVYADVNANMPRSYWDYDSVNISWGALENYEVVRKIGTYNP